MPVPAPRLGDIIRAARERKSWTQAQLGEAIGVDRKTVDNWENGRTEPRNSIARIEDALGIRIRQGVPIEDAIEDVGPVIEDRGYVSRTDALRDATKDELLEELARRIGEE